MKMREGAMGAIPDKETIKSQEDKEIDDLIERYRKKQLRSKIFPNQEFKTHFKRALPEASQSLRTALDGMRKMNPERRGKSLAKITNQVFKGD